MSENIINHVDDSTFEELVLNSGLPVSILVTARWSGLSERMLPIFEEVSREYAGKITPFVAKAETFVATNAEYGIRIAPTIVIFKNKKLVTVRHKYVGEKCLRKFLDSQLD